MNELVNTKDPHAAVLVAQALVKGESKDIPILFDEMQALKKLVKDLNYDPSHMGIDGLDLNKPEDFSLWLDLVRDFTDSDIEL